MSTHDRDDPGADTATFRAYVEQPAEAGAETAPNRTLIIGLVVAAVVLAIIVLALVLS
jgi:hypothetical protein